MSMTAPLGLRLSRAKGFDLQRNSRDANGRAAINVARPGPWGNPFIVGIDGTRAECVDLYAKLLGGYLCLTTMASVESQKQSRAYVFEHIKELSGKNLACWCALGAPCHRDVLLQVAKDVAAW